MDHNHCNIHVIQVWTEDSDVVELRHKIDDKFRQLWEEGIIAYIKVRVTFTLYHIPYTIHRTPYTIHHTPYTIPHNIRVTGLRPKQCSRARTS
ncbi:hypothetical protein EON63_08485 [archaeon]|nr:MAG: hypothetical protein EON63_08485 [archaeon]